MDTYNSVVVAGGVWVEVEEHYMHHLHIYPYRINGDGKKSLKKTLKKKRWNMMPETISFIQNLGMGSFSIVLVLKSQSLIEVEVVCQ